MKKKVDKKKLERLSDSLNGVEDRPGIKDHPKVLAWQIYINLPKARQQKLRRQWQQYYLDVRQTTAYKRYFAQRPAFFKKDTATVLELAEESREQKNMELTKPSTWDPDQLAQCWEVNCFNRLTDAINSFDIEVEEIFT